METTHTPGPYLIKVVDGPASLYCVYTSDGAVIAAGVKGLANARLIAATPELLDFARKATDYIKRHSEANQDIADYDLLDEGEAAIAKATQ